MIERRPTCGSVSLMPYPSRANDPQVDAVLRRLGSQVRHGRRISGLSQRQVEARTGIDQTTISRLENGIATRLPLERLGLVLLAVDVELRARPTTDATKMPDGASLDGPAERLPNGA